MKRNFTHFKPGDVVEVQKHCLEFWQSLRQVGTTFTVTRIARDSDLHAYEEKCENTGCIHSFTHPDQLWLKGGTGWASAFWFDPECEKYQPKEEKNA